MRILITADLTLGLFSNGMNQNILSLYKLLEGLGHEVHISSLENAKKHNTDKRDYNIIELQDVYKKKMKIDYLIQGGVTYGDKIVKELKDNCGDFKNVHIHYGPRFFTDIELSLRPDQGVKGSMSRHKDFVDEVWISPHYEYSFDYFRILYCNSEIKTLPYIWSPEIVGDLEKQLNKMDKTAFYEKGGPAKIAVLEPNNYVKHSLCPAMIIEHLYNNNPELIETAGVFGTYGHRDQGYYTKLMCQLDVVQDYKMNFFDRVPFTNIFSGNWKDKYNYIVSHQHLNALNYTYLEAFYFGIPIVHNSEFIKNEAGYYYKDFDLINGSEMLKKAILTHDNNLEKYKEDGQKIIWKYHPENPEVINQYKKLL